MAKLQILFFVFALRFAYSLTLAQGLRAEYSKAKLSRPRYDVAAVYDGKDSIFLFGGAYRSDSSTSTIHSKDIQRYNVHSDSIETVGQMPESGDNGSVQMIGSNIYYFGSGSNPGCVNTTICFNILKYDTTTGVTSIVGNSSAKLIMTMTAFKQESASVIYFHHHFSISSFDTTTLQISKVVENLNFSAQYSAVVNNFAYTFGYALLDGRNRTMSKIDLNSNNFTNIEVFSSNLPPYLFYGTAFADDFNIYTFVAPRSVNFTAFLVQINPTTLEWSPLYIENFPIHDIHYDFPPRAVFVRKMNRIYFFGGQRTYKTSNFKQLDDSIWYIDLPVPIPTATTTDTPTTTPSPTSMCEGKENGIYTNPADPSSYIWCRYGIPIEIKCPTP